MTEDNSSRRFDAVPGVEVCGLVKQFGETRALDGLNLVVPAGAVCGILGPNGAGKTTTIRILATLLRPDAGTAQVLGHDVVREADAVRRRICLTGQFAALDEDLTGGENLALLGCLLGLPRASEETSRRVARGVRPSRRRQAAGKHVLRRHAPPR